LSPATKTLNVVSSNISERMVKTVNEAFDVFLKNNVNLDSNQTQKARASREWLIEQIDSFPNKDLDFPRLYSEKNIHFGSFARCTKKRELDDIDQMITLNAEGSCYNELANRIEIHVPDSAYQLKLLCSDNTNILNSIKVINKFVKLLGKVPQYQKADIKRNQEAATLNLSSYPWVFDLVPCFFTQLNYLNKNYYLIPDGRGHWKKTDPRIDRQRVTDVNQFHNGNVLNVIRLLKYWNRRPTMPSMSSYLIENIILDFYSARFNKASKFVDLEILDLLNYIQSRIYYSVNDPKGIQGNINQLSYEDQTKISKRAYADYLKAVEARRLEENKDHSSSIIKWREIFGSNFPIYI
jgi:hypothetical protein